MILEPPVEVVMSDASGFLNPSDPVEIFRHPGGALPDWTQFNNNVALIEPGAGNVLYIELAETIYLAPGALTEFGIFFLWGSSPRIEGETPVNGVYQDAQAPFGGRLPAVLGNLKRSTPGPLGAGSMVYDWEEPIIRFPTPFIGAGGLYGQNSIRGYGVRLVAPRDACRVYIYTQPNPYSVVGAALYMRAAFGSNCQGALQPEFGV
jgi:hypothetical protein